MKENQTKRNETTVERGSIEGNGDCKDVRLRIDYSLKLELRKLANIFHIAVHLRNNETNQIF